MYTLNIHYSLQRNDQDKNATGYKFILTNLVVMYEEQMTEDKVRNRVRITEYDQG